MATGWNTGYTLPQASYSTSAYATPNSYSYSPVVVNNNYSPAPAYGYAQSYNPYGSPGQAPYPTSGLGTGYTGYNPYGASQQIGNGSPPYGQLPYGQQPGYPTPLIQNAAGIPAGQTFSIPVNGLGGLSGQPAINFIFQIIKDSIVNTGSGNQSVAFNNNSTNVTDTGGGNSNSSSGTSSADILSDNSSSAGRSNANETVAKFERLYGTKWRF